MAANNEGLHHGLTRRLVSLWDDAHGTSLDGAGIQAWLDWEHEALRLGIEPEISRADLEALVQRSRELR